MENKIERLKIWFNSGITYEAFSEFINEGLINPAIFDETALKYSDYIKMNKQRSSRIEKTFIPDQDLVQIAQGISGEQYWLIITEEWCGDSAQNLPYIAKIAALNKNIKLKIVFRDENIELMDMYLTNGKSRSIPKLVVFNNNRELFTWGPRPGALQKYISEISSSRSKEEILNDIHLWYGRNKGIELIKEFKELLLKSSS